MPGSQKHGKWDRVNTLSQQKGSSIVGYNLTADAVQPYPLGALACSLSDLFTSVNPYGWHKGMDIPDGRFLKYVPDGFLDEMQKLAKRKPVTFVCMGCCASERFDGISEDTE